MKTNLSKSLFAVLLMLISISFFACDIELGDGDTDGDESGTEEDGSTDDDSSDDDSSATSGPIRNDEDAKLVADGINTVLEQIRGLMSYGKSYSDYSPEEGGYVMNGAASSGPIFSGSYTYEYEKNFTVVFDNYTDNNGFSIESGTIDYDYTDYSSSGYHLIIEVRGQSGIKVVCENGEYTIEDTITGLMMGDSDDDENSIWASFTSSSGKSCAAADL